MRKVPSNILWDIRLKFDNLRDGDIDFSRSLRSTLRVVVLGKEVKKLGHMKRKGQKKMTQPAQAFGNFVSFFLMVL